MSDFIFENEGYCPCCRSETKFGAYNEWLRDFYVCTKCGSIPRQRHVQTVLDERFPNWTELVLHESSPSNDYLSRWAGDYTASQYFDDVPRGAIKDGVRSESIEDLTFDDESIDIFITQDVMEHVFNPDRAIAEIHRVLKPGGAHVFTTPKHRNVDKTVQRARLDESGEVVNILEAQWHGNPIGERALVTYDFGYDFERLLSEWSGVSVDAIQTVDRDRGLDAEFNEVFVIVKPGASATDWRRSVRQIGHDAARAKRLVTRKGRSAAGRLVARGREWKQSS